MFHVKTFYISKDGKWYSHEESILILNNELNIKELETKKIKGKDVGDAITFSNAAAIDFGDLPITGTGGAGWPSGSQED